MGPQQTGGQGHDHRHRCGGPVECMQCACTRDEDKTSSGTLTNPLIPLLVFVCSKGQIVRLKSWPMACSLMTARKGRSRCGKGAEEVVVITSMLGHQPAIELPFRDTFVVKRSVCGCDCTARWTVVGEVRTCGMGLTTLEEGVLLVPSGLHWSESSSSGSPKSHPSNGWGAKSW